MLKASLKLIEFYLGECYFSHLMFIMMVNKYYYRAIV